MNLFLFILKTRAVNLLKTDKGKSKIVIQLFLYFVMLAYMIGLSFILDQPDGKISPKGKEVLMIAIGVMYLVLPLMNGFFPGLEPKATLIPEIYPVSKIKKWLLEEASEIFSTTNLALVSLYAAIVLFSDFANYKHMLVFLSAFTAVIQFNHALRSMIFRIRKNTPVWVVVTLGYLAVVVYALFEFRKADFAVFLPIIGALGFGAINFLLEMNQTGSKQVVEKTQEKSFWNHFPLHSLYFRTKPLRTALLLGVVFKIFFMGFLVFAAEEKKNLAFAIFLLGSPLLYFSYALANLWGFVSKVWLNLQLYKNGERALFITFLKFVGPLILLDGICTLSISFFTDNTALFIGFYFSSLVYAVIVGFWASIWQGKLVKSYSFTNGTNQVSMAVTFPMGGGLCILLLPIWFPVTWPLLIVVPLLLISSLYFLPKGYDMLSEKLFYKLVKAEEE